jgi:dihydropyrimidinase
MIPGYHAASTLGVDGSKYYDKDWRTAAGFVMSPPLNPDPQVKLDMMRRVSAKQIDVVSTVGGVDLFVNLCLSGRNMM